MQLAGNGNGFPLNFLPGRTPPKSRTRNHHRRHYHRRRHPHQQKIQQFQSFPKFITTQAQQFEPPPPKQSPIHKLHLLVPPLHTLHPISPPPPPPPPPASLQGMGNLYRRGSRAMRKPRMLKLFLRLFHHQWPPLPPLYKPPVFVKPLPPPIPVYTPTSNPPVSKPPVYKPPISKPPVYKPPIKPPVSKPPVYKPPKKPCPPIVKPLTRADSIQATRPQPKRSRRSP
ncbi:PREDICTED: repetitive proline-rich cell wall protein 1-like [Erythranthe guttata]|uniref:repetitive proline-rich cell wall protein 1-like n=1 Tax=Erythranthe guttata TaxID=4155 RepID=UPI00064DC293|nr:PREDICTED: repetitive proline-rich cell wall protein 1-like [Erythranthe guttata]|eukprot:XP_012836450.1 PREDICTED: repetitive proline-rich cell wall protein 1-like [Erythranthe guttata]